LLGILPRILRIPIGFQKSPDSQPVDWVPKQRPGDSIVDPAARWYGSDVNVGLEFT